MARAPHPAHWRAQWIARPAWCALTAEAAAVFLATILTALAQRWLRLEPDVPASLLVPLLQVATAGAAAVVALLGFITTRLRPDAGWPWVVATAWTFYALVVMPLTAVVTAGVNTGVVGVIVRSGVFAAATAFLGLLAGGLRGGRGRWLSGARGLASAVLFTAVAMCFAALLPTLAASTLASPVPDVVVTCGWLALSSGFTRTGLRRREPTQWRVGLGLGVVASAHLLRLASGGLVVESQVLRLLGLLVLVAGLGRHVRCTVLELRERSMAAAERAAVQAHAHAQRDHEMRNALANLAAVPTLFHGHQPVLSDGLDAVHLMRSELSRLGDLLENRPGADESGAPVEEILNRLATLHRAGGMPVTVHCPPRLFAAVPSAVLAQVITNLLVNCTRHAPGAAVRVRAEQSGDTCLITVADNGPGLRPGPDGASTAGSGLGLALTTQLLAGHQGRLRLGPTTADGAGCTAHLELPIAQATHWLPSMPAMP